MKFSPSVRELHHHRKINLRFYHRADGFFEVEGTLTDHKKHPYRLRLDDQDRPPHEAVHDMTVTLIFDEYMCIHSATAKMQATPFSICRQAENTLTPLIGLSMKKGWRKNVQALLAGSQSCTHLMELMGPLATTAHQGLAPLRRDALNDPENEAGRLAKVDSCYAYAASRPIVAKLWPHLHTPTSK